jgi:DNA repair protein RadA/Sms
MDIFVNVAGGLKISDRGIDLGICLAIYSSIKNISLAKTVGIGEVGLLGEIRTVPLLEKRVREAKRLGFSNVLTVNSSKFLNAMLQSVGK